MCTWQSALGLTLLGLLSIPAPAPAADLHLVQQAEVRNGSAAPVEKRQRELFLHGNQLALRSAKNWLIIRRDLNTAWLLDQARRPIRQVPLSQIKARSGAALIPGVQLPGLTATGDTKTVAGLSCDVYALNVLVLRASVCVTQDLPALEAFNDLLGESPDIPGVPLESDVTLEVLGRTVRQVSLKIQTISTDPIDPAVFAVPQGSPKIAEAPDPQGPVAEEP